MIDENSSPALLLTGVNANPPQYGREEIVLSVDLEGKIVVAFHDGRDILRRSGVDRAGVLTADLLFEPALIRNYNAKPIG